MADLVAEIREFLATAVPNALIAVEVVKRTVRGLAVADVVEDEELRLRAEVRGVRDARLLQVSRGL